MGNVSSQRAAHVAASARSQRPFLQPEPVADFPTMRQLLNSINTKEYVEKRQGRKLTAIELTGQCAFAANELVKLLRKKGFICRYRRGYWHGQDRRPGRQGFPFQGHSWCEIRLYNKWGVVLADPTRWVFWAESPSIAYLDCRNNLFEVHNHYDGEGRKIMEGQYPIDHAELTKLLGKKGKWTINQAHKVAHVHPDRLPPGTHKRLEDQGYVAMIPIDFTEIEEFSS